MKATSARNRAVASDGEGGARVSNSTFFASDHSYAQQICEFEMELGQWSPIFHGELGLLGKTKPQFELTQLLSHPVRSGSC